MTNILTYSHLGLTSKEKCYENKNNCIDTYNSMEALVYENKNNCIDTYNSMEALVLTLVNYMSLPFEVLFCKFCCSDWWVFIIEEGTQIT